MQYFVTGATGFIGRRLVRALLARRGATVHFLVRPGSAHKVPGLLKYWGASRRRAIPVEGDLGARRLGVAPQQLKALKGRVDHVFHLAALYDLEADAASQVAVNVEGTRRLVEFAHAIDAGHVHHVSSVAVAGLYEGVFREDMFDEAGPLEHPYFSTKHEAEAIVRRECRRPWTIYRPAMVVGDSRTGEMDKVDGPYYFFRLIQRMRQLLPPWIPSIGVEGGHVNIVPVDFVVAAIDHISRQVGERSGGCYHLVDTEDLRVGEVLGLFAQAAHAPRMSLFVNAALLGRVPRGVRTGVLALAPVRRVRDAVMQDLGLPADVLDFLNLPTRYDQREAAAALQGSGIACPPLRDYAWRLWDHWERHLEPALSPDRSLSGAVAGRVVLVTGGSSGIGLASACRFAEAGAITLICARDVDKLAAARAQILEHAHRAGRDGARVETYAVDLTDEAACHACMARIQQDFGGVDLLVNSAGHSIRRSIEASYDRFHDFERTMQLNYFACLRVTLALLPGMVARGRGHVVNISSIGVLTSAPRFAAYVASKAALDAWTRCAASEFANRGVTFTTVNMPLVRTPMIAPTKLYDHVPALSPERAAALVVRACVERPVRLATPLGVLGMVAQTVMPGVAQNVMNTAFRLFSDSPAPP